jgi:tRNA(adenine34) deaminase
MTAGRRTSDDQLRSESMVTGVRLVEGGKVARQKGEGRMAEKRRDSKRWVSGVKTDSTHPPEGAFTKDSETIARTMAKKDVSPKGIGSAIRMIQYFINRAGKNLPAARRRELEKAKTILQTKRENKDDSARS